MADKLTDQTGGPLGGEAPLATAPDPALEASLIPLPLPPDTRPGARSRLLALFRRPGRVRQGPGSADPDPPPHTAGPESDVIAPELTGPEAGSSDPEPDVTAPELTGPHPDGTGPELTGPEAVATKGARARPRGVLARLFGRKRAEPTPSGSGADRSGPGPAAPTEIPAEAPPAVAELSPAFSEPSGPPGRERGASGGADRRGGPDPARRGFPPIQVLIGWVGESSRRDVLQHARGFATDHIETLETAWVAMAEFRGGTLFEVHEGGGGRAYLPELIETISRDPDQVLWVPSGTKLNRVVTFSIVEGRPFSMMLNEAESARVRASGQAPVERTGRMRRLSPRGNAVLTVGATLFAVSLTALAGSAFLASQVGQQPLPSLSYNADILPHGQIVSLSDALREDRWVSRILFENGAWRAEFETFEDLVLPDETGAAQQVIDEAVERDEVLRRERDRKIEELRGE